MPSLSSVAPVLIAGEWRAAKLPATFAATNPRTREPIDRHFPVSGWSDVESALSAADAAAIALRAMPDSASRIADFLNRYAAEIEANAEALVAAAHEETGLPASPRLKEVELPRTTGQLRQAAAAAHDGNWQRPVIDTKAGLRSCLAPVGPVLVIGPNNFPFAFNGIAGGDFAAAIAAGNPVIAKGHPLHPQTTRLLAEAAHRAATAAGLPGGVVQCLYHMEPEVGLRAIAEDGLKAIAFTGSRVGGLKLKAAADAAGVPFFGEMSSVNPTVLLHGALSENAAGIAEQLAASVLMGTGQFCTKPGLVLLTENEATSRFINTVAEKLKAAPSGVLFSKSGEDAITTACRTLRNAGAEEVTGGPGSGAGFGIANTLLRVEGRQFIANAHALQTEAFGNAVLCVVAKDTDELLSALRLCEGSLTGTVYSAADGSDETAYHAVAAVLRPRVGRLINDKMPTGVAVSPAQNHGGPFPATSQPHFTAVGIPASISRFTQLECYDNVRDQRLPACLRDFNSNPKLWRQIDGVWTAGNFQG